MFVLQLITISARVNVHWKPVIANEKTKLITKAINVLFAAFIVKVVGDSNAEIALQP